MLFFNHHTYSTEPPILNKQEVGEFCHWNMWQLRMMPFHELKDGTRIVMVESWPRGGRLSWEIEASDVVAQAYSSKRVAIRVISDAVGLSESEVRSHPYSEGRP